MVSSNVQRIYDEYISTLSPTERLRMVELITRGMAQPEPINVSPLDPTTITEIPSWQATDQRGVTQWRDRSL
jgi:hypothetical protein